MILQSLVQYYEVLERNGKVTRPGWCRAKVSFALDIAEDGQLLGVIPLKQQVVQGKKTSWIPVEMKVPEMVTRSSGFLPNFLCDNSSYILGIDNKGKPQRSIKCFQHARDWHHQLLNEVDNTASKAVRAYFEKWKPEAALENKLLEPHINEIISGANLVFYVDGGYAHENKEIKDVWEKQQGREKDAIEGICLVTGQQTEIARIHGTIKGVPGAQSSGAALVSFNASAFESYGKEQSFNSPVGVYAAYAYTTALNYLLAEKKHRTSIGDTVIVYWSEDGDEAYQDAFSAVTEPTIDNQEIIDGVFKNLQKGNAIEIKGVQEKLNINQRFYILGISPNAARLSVRFFYQDSFGNILQHIKSHYERMEIIRPATDSLQYMGVWRMLQETVNKKSRDKKPASNMASAVYRGIISGGLYPAALYQAVLSRIRAEQDDTDSRIYKITRGRAAIIKAYLLRNGNGYEEEITVALNEESKNVAYILGRQFAVLEEIQEKANPEINATIKDRYFNAACATPASIFPILFKLGNSHIKKIKDIGTRISCEKKLIDLQNKISFEDDQNAYPKRLTLEEQGVFVLGYYHQTQKRYEKKDKGGN